MLACTTHYIPLTQDITYTRLHYGYLYLKQYKPFLVLLLIKFSYKFTSPNLKVRRSSSSCSSITTTSFHYYIKTCFQSLIIMGLPLTSIRLPHCNIRAMWRELKQTSLWSRNMAPLIFRQKVQHMNTRKVHIILN